MYYTDSFGWNLCACFLCMCNLGHTHAFSLKNCCGFNTKILLFWCFMDITGAPQTLAEIWRNMAIFCGFGAVAARGKYPGFMQFPIHTKTRIGDYSDNIINTISDTLDYFIWNFNSLSPVRCGCDFMYGNFKHNLMIANLSIQVNITL